MIFGDDEGSFFRTWLNTLSFFQVLSRYEIDPSSSVSLFKLILSSASLVKDCIFRVWRWSFTRFPSTSPINLWISSAYRIDIVYRTCGSLFNCTTHYDDLRSSSRRDGNEGASWTVRSLPFMMSDNHLYFAITFFEARYTR